jgi:adenylosuccinate synthase
MKAYIVVGINYGDEGKGLMVDYLTRIHSPSFVSRFNGGAQAGHTVMTTLGHRHVFSHYGAGTFAKSDTYLTSDYIINPYLLDVETEELRPKIDHFTHLYAHPNARVTTLFDMAINKVAEARRSSPHGTCGVGINETVTRESKGPSLQFIDFFKGNVCDIIRSIHREWVPQRLNELGVGQVVSDDPWVYGHVLSPQYTEYDEQAEAMEASLRRIKLEHHLPPTESLVYEGAQGLALDEEFGIFPHVTRSFTGVHNAIRSAITQGATEIQPIYVTRAYTTRHGAGPLLYEGEHITHSVLSDATNVCNRWQGTLRYAPLDLHQMQHLIHSDMHRAQTISIPETVTLLSPHVAVTCLDQIVEWVNVYDTNKSQQRVHLSSLLQFIESQLKYTVKYASFGPTAESVRMICG